MKFRYHFVFLTLLLLPHRSLHAQLLEKKVLSLEAAEKVASAAALEAKKRNATVVIVVVDDGGYPLVLKRLDDTQVASVEVGIGKTDDPVRLYLKEMGTVPLLSKEGEVAIAKRIEDGKREAAQVLYSLPFSLQDVRDLGDKLRKGKISIHEVVHAGDDDFDDLQTQNEEELHARVLKLISEIDRHSKDLATLSAHVHSSRSTEARKKSLRDKMQTTRYALFDKLEALNIHCRQTDRLVLKLREMVSEVLLSEREVHGLERKTSLSLDELKDVFRKMRQGERELKNAARRLEMKQETLLVLEKTYRNAAKRVKKIEEDCGVPELPGPPVPHSRASVAGGWRRRILALANPAVPFYT